MAWPESGPHSQPSPYDGGFSVDKGSAVLAPARGLAIGVVAGLCGWIVLALVHIGVDVWRLVLLAEGEPIDQRLLGANDAAFGALSLAQYGAMVVVAVALVIWLFRVRANVEKINDRPHRWGRPWLVLAWIVPIASLWWPKQLVDDIWIASDPRFLKASDWRRPWLVRAWWTVWILYVLLDGVFARVPDPSTGVDIQREAATRELMVAPFGVAAALLAIWVVWRLSRLQDTRGRELERMLAE